MRESVNISVPGSLMMLGEHAVLRGKRALACAIDKRMRVSLSKREDGLLTIESQLGSYESPVSEVAADSRFRFVLEAVKECGAPQQGVNIQIESSFSHQVGFGSSAAVTVGVVQGLSLLQSKQLSERQLIERGSSVIRAVQGLGSGTDVAASVLGGVICYRAEPLEFRKLDFDCPIAVAYSGAKMPTAEVVRLVNEAERSQPEKFARIFAEMDESVASACELLSKKDYRGFGKVLNLNQELMAELGVSSPRLEELVAAFRAADGVYGAKITGSGLGDCVLALGEFAAQLDGLIGVAVDSKGVCVEEG